MEEEIIRSASKAEKRIFVSIDTITENFAGDINYVQNRAKSLERIISQTPRSSFIVTHTIKKWLQKEQINSGRLVNVPTFSNSQRWENFMGLLADSKQFSIFQANLKSMSSPENDTSEKLKLKDRIFRNKCQTIKDPELVCKLLADFKLEARNSHLTLFSKALGISVSKSKAIVSAPGNLYKIHRAYLASLYLRSLGNAFQSFDKYPDFKFLRKIARGNWFDLAIIVQASQFDNLVSEDVDQREICNFLNSKGIIKSTAIDYTDFKKMTILS